LRKYATSEEAFAAGQLSSQAEQLRLYRHIATMDAAAPLPPIADQAPTWSRAAALARDWELNRLAQRFEDLAKAA
jgi:DNA polymerase-1